MPATRVLSAALSLALICSGCSAPEPPSQASSQCLLLFTYERETELSERVWNFLQAQSYSIMDNTTYLPTSAQWYTPGEGRAGLVYLVDCESAERGARSMVADLARRADPDVARELRRANSSWREISQAEFEDAQ